MNFAFDASKTQPGAVPTTSAPATGLPSFSFGAAGAGDAAKPLGTGFPLMSNTPQAKPGGLFGTGISTPPQNTGFSFGTPSTAAPALGAPTTPQTSGLTFGAAAPANTGLTFGTAAPANTGLAFGTPSTAATTGFPTPAPAATAPSFGLGAVPTTATPTTGLSFGAKPAASTAFSLGGGEAPASAGPTGITFGTPSTMTTATGFNLGSTPTSTTPSATTSTASGFHLGGNITSTTSSLDSSKASTEQSGFNLPTQTTATLQPSTGFGTSTANTTASTGFLATSGTTSAPAPTAFSFGTGTTAASTPGFSLNKTATAPTSLAAPSTQATLGTTTTVTSSASGSQPAPINFFQLEESINKWTLELEEQEKVFVNQASQVNAWDKLLITNGEKIVTLNQEVERVKIEQQQLEHELDYVVGQQKELQDCLVPLEKELASLSVSDPEREYTYRLAENLDTQLKRMSEDLKEIIEHLNQANRSQDSTDPIVQIGKILNAHMNSLQWLDQQTGLLSQKIQQIDQMHQNFRQENERSFNLAYN